MDIAVVYHYVNFSSWKGIFPITPKDFTEQIELISKDYEIVSPEELEKPQKNKPRCVLTFDDGTKDQYENAFSILSKKGLPGYFTVMSGPLQEKRIPIFHLVHTVLSIYSDEVIWEELNESFFLNDVKTLGNLQYSYEKNETRRFNKYALNFYLDERDSRKFLMKKMLQKYKSVEKFIEEYYITTSEWIKMKTSGMTLGVHCVNHLPYSGDPSDFYVTEIEPCIVFMERDLHIKPQWYTPAFGGGEKALQMMKELQPLLEEKGFKGGFTTLKGTNRGISNFWLNRLDCASMAPLSKSNF